MSNSFEEDPFAPARIRDPRPAAPPSLPLIAQYGLALVFVALATGLAFLVQHLISAPNVTLIYVLPVIISATLFGWGPSLLAVAVGVIAFDFFFTEPYYSLTMTNPSEIWAAVLLFVIASIVTSVAAQSRRRAMEAREAAERAQALQALAHTVIEGRSQSQILQAAATALHQIFRAPAAILMQCENRFEAVATAGSAQITEADREAARGALRRTKTPEGIPIHTWAPTSTSGRSRHPPVATVSWASILCMRRVNGRIHSNKPSR